MKNLTVSDAKTHFNRLVRDSAAYDELVRIENQRTKDAVILMSERTWQALAAA